eukprot:144588_1
MVSLWRIWTQKWTVEKYQSGLYAECCYDVMLTPANEEDDKKLIYKYSSANGDLSTMMQSVNRRFIKGTECWKKANANITDSAEIPDWVRKPGSYLYNLDDPRYATLKQTKKDFLDLCILRRGETQHKGRPLTTAQWEMIYLTQYELYYPKKKDDLWDPQKLLKALFIQTFPIQTGRSAKEQRKRSWKEDIKIRYDGKHYIELKEAMWTKTLKTVSANQGRVCNVVHEREDQLGPVHILRICDTGRPRLSDRIEKSKPLETAFFLRPRKKPKIRSDGTVCYFENTAIGAGTIDRTWKDTQLNAGIKHPSTMYSTRAMIGTAYRKQGYSPFVIKDILGHKDFKTMIRYHFLVEQEQKSNEKGKVVDDFIDRMIKKKKTLNGNQSLKQLTDGVKDMSVEAQMPEIPKIPWMMRQHKNGNAMNQNLMMESNTNMKQEKQRKMNVKYSFNGGYCLGNNRIVGPKYSGHAQSHGIALNNKRIMAPQLKQSFGGHNMSMRAQNNACGGDFMINHGMEQEQGLAGNGLSQVLGVIHGNPIGFQSEGNISCNGMNQSGTFGGNNGFVYVNNAPQNRMNQVAMQRNQNILSVKANEKREQEP